MPFSPVSTAGENKVTDERAESINAVIKTFRWPVEIDRRVCKHAVQADRLRRADYASRKRCLNESNLTHIQSSHR